MKKYDVVIIGAGVTGAALLYVLSNYTNLKRLAIVEKYSKAAQVNSHSDNNSQTLHFGDIETNIDLRKAEKLKIAAGMLVRYVEREGGDALFRKSHKIVLAVGDKEVRQLEERFNTLKHLFSKLKKIEREEIAAIEPRIVQGRNPNQKIIALYSEDGYAINYQKLSESFVANALKDDKKVDVFFDTRIDNITKLGDTYFVNTNKETLTADFVAVSAGPYSLLFAQALGYGQGLGILPVAGSFYCADNILGGKVYTVQDPKLPFAAIHGDPSVTNPHQTRFGPTAKVLPLLERHKYESFWDFLKTPIVTLKGLLSLVKISSDWTVFKYLLKNFFYDSPVIGKWLFIKKARKIVPSLKYGELRFGKGLGGIRPQVVDTNSRTLKMGEAKIIGENIVFNITPSPGATICFKNAENDTKIIGEALGDRFVFDEERFKKDFYPAETANSKTL